MAQPTGTFTAEDPVAVTPALVAPESYVADNAEILREIARLVSEQGLPAPLSYMAAGQVVIRMNDDDTDAVDAWARQLSLVATFSSTVFETDSPQPWASYGGERWADEGGWLGRSVHVWTVAHVEGGQS